MEGAVDIVVVIGWDIVVAIGWRDALGRSVLVCRRSGLIGGGVLLA